MAVNQEVCTNPAVVEVIQKLITKHVGDKLCAEGRCTCSSMGAPVTHGEFNRHMFIETIVLKGGTGISMDRESIMDYACITEREFNTIKDEYLAQGVIKVENNPMVGEPLYSLLFTPIGGDLTTDPG